MWSDNYSAFSLVTWLCAGLRFAAGLECNRCFNADKVVDCQRATETCAPGQSCYRDSSHITYRTNDDRTLTVWMYKMGCTYTPICRDGISYGPGPYGYSRIIRFCCCTDRCNEPDGTGHGDYTNCSINVVNGTVSAAVPILHLPSSLHCHTGMLTSLAILIGAYRLILRLLE